MSSRAGLCYHCGETLPAKIVQQARVAGTLRDVCCHGCRAAAEWIELLGLTDYYRLRTQPAQKPADDSRVLANLAAWQRPQVARHLVRDAGEGRREMVLLIDGVRCSACIWLIERALGAMTGVINVQVNSASRRARILWDDTRTTLPQILDTLARTGYQGLPLDAEALDDARRRESRDAMKRLLVAGFGAMQAMMFAAVLYLGALDLQETSTRDLFRWLGFLAAAPVVFYSAQPFFAGAARSLKAHQPGMDVPVAIAIAAIYIASLIEALRGGDHVYFDSVAMFVLFLLAGRYLEMRARHRAGDLTDALARLTPPFADRRGADGTLERVGTHELQLDDCVHIGEGALVPGDGALLSMRCRVDESLLSGESSPVTKVCGDPLIAGSVLLDGPAELRITRIGGNTALAAIATLTAHAQAQRPRLAQLGEQEAVRFVKRILALTALTVVCWSFIDPSRAFAAALAVLVVSCPCAFALAVPAAITRALAVLASRGVLVVKPDAIQNLAETTHVIFDKTGTLTEPGVANITVYDQRPRASTLRLAAAIARESAHPAARVIATFCAEERASSPVDVATNVQAHSGLGISATVGGNELRLGRADFALHGALGRSQVPQGCGDAVILADEHGAIAAFHLSERLRPEARVAIDALKAQGLQVLIASGDAAAKVADIAALLDVPRWRARQLPADKLAQLMELRAAGAKVIVVGDGVNDAAMLAGADVAVALAGSAELAQASSDIVMNAERLSALAGARTLARQTLAILHQNHRWAMLYNLTAVPLAALGLIHPWVAALGMSLSSVCVILNALRIGNARVAAAKPATGELMVPGTAAA